MNPNISDSAAEANTSLLRSKQVSPLPVGPGGMNSVKRQLNDTNIQLTMLTAQANADTKYDPPVPKPITKAVTIENFSEGIAPMMPIMFGVVGGLFIVYAFIAK